MSSDDRWILLHNPRCSKSRQSLALLQAQGAAVDVRLYLHAPLQHHELVQLIEQLEDDPQALLRTTEPAYRQHVAPNHTVTTSELIELLQQHPILFQRPIAWHRQRAKIGRPPEAILTLAQAH